MKAKASVLGERIFLRTVTAQGEFDEALARCKAVRGGRFVRQPENGWTYPLTASTCHRLREVWGEHLRIHDSLADWYRANAANAAIQADLSASGDAALERLPLVAPVLHEALDPPQRVGAAWVANAYRDAGLVADEPGSGKTMQVIGGILEAGLTGAFLVACPRVSVKTVWANEFRKWGVDDPVYLCRGTRARRQRAITRFMEDPSERKWLITVAEVLRIKEEPNPESPNRPKFAGYEYPELFQIPWAAVIVDESHKAFGSLTVVKGNLMGKGLKRLQAARRYAVTGTPFGKGGRLQGMFGTLMWLWPEEYTSFWRWAEEHFHIDEEEVYIAGGRGRKRLTRKVGGLKGGIGEEEFLRDLGPRILRRTKEETMPWLPSKQYTEVVCEMEPAQRKQYEALVNDGEFVAGEGVVSVDGVLAAITRAKQVANGALFKDEEGAIRFDPKASCKIDNLMQRLDQRGILDDSGYMKVLVTSQFNEFLYAVRDVLDEKGVPYLLLTGKTTDRQREAMIEEFQKDGGPRVFMLNAKAGGVSVTLDAADEVHMLDELWDPGDNIQVEDRIHRRSRGSDRPPARVVQYRTEGTIDTNIGEDVEARRAAQHAVLDGRRGMDYVRTLVAYQPNTEEE